MKPAFSIGAATAVIAVLGIGVLAVGAGPTPGGLFRTPDQQGWKHFRNGEFREAAVRFEDPLWQGTAWYRAGEFKKAAEAFARRDSAEAQFNQGNARLMHGDYPGAIACYDRALEARPDWSEALENREVAVVRGDRTKAEGGDMGDQKLGADDMVYDANASSEGQETEVAGGDALSDQQVQALWLRRVQTRPADFLKAKFAYQQAMPQEGGP